jgi:hypothetical protein
MRPAPASDAGLRLSPALRIAFSTDDVIAVSKTVTISDRGSRTETCASFERDATAPYASTLTSGNM